MYPVKSEVVELSDAPTNDSEMPFWVYGNNYLWMNDHVLLQVNILTLIK